MLIVTGLLNLLFTYFYFFLFFIFIFFGGWEEKKGRGSVREIKSYINDRSLERPENAMRCSKMVEVVE
jgi:hypothetical protein